MIEQLLEIGHQYPLKNYASTLVWSEMYTQRTQGKTPIEKAVLGGYICQQFSFAFLSGYQAALEKMFPDIGPGRMKALCVSEANGSHPKSIETSLEDNQVNGVKTYVTAGSDAEHLLVLCKTDEIRNGRPVLKIVHLTERSPQVEISDFELDFMKDIKHGRLIITDAQVSSDQILEGDGFGQYAKPFRTLEDIMVASAYQAMLLRQAIENKWEADVRDQLVLNIFNMRQLLPLDPLARETHLLLASVEKRFEQLLPSIEEQIEHHATQVFKEDWHLNKKAISLGKKAKKIRLAKARELLFSSA